MTIAFVWQGITGRYGQWQDGLYAAMKIIEKEHNVFYLEPNSVVDFSNIDVVLYWEAPCTILGKDAEHYKRMQKLPLKKALLFAGGRIEKEWLKGFDLVFVESKINEEEMEALGIPWKRAFGINSDIFKPVKQAKFWDGIHQATCASWKRQWLMAEALGNKSVLCGRFQESDPEPFNRSERAGAIISPELTQEQVAQILNSSYTMCQTSDFWGGGQRATLEALACGVPVVVMEDSPKNREYVEECNGGIVIPPHKEQIKWAVDKLKAEWTDEDAKRVRAYIESKWTPEIYAKNLLEGIHGLLNNNSKL